MAMDFALDICIFEKVENKCKPIEIVFKNSKSNKVGRKNWNFDIN